MRGERPSTAFLSSLNAFLGIATGIYCAALSPEQWILPQRILSGVIAVVASVWLYSLLIPPRLLGLPEHPSTGRPGPTLAVAFALQFWHPSWLSGPWFGWINPFFPVLLLAVQAACLWRLWSGRSLRGGRQRRRPLSSFSTGVLDRYQAAARLEQQRQYDDAERAHREIIELEPSFYISYVSVAALVLAKGKAEESERLCRRAIEIEPEYANAHYYLGFALKRQGRKDEAVDAIQKSILLGLPKELERTLDVK